MGNEVCCLPASHLSSSCQKACRTWYKRYQSCTLRCCKEFLKCICEGDSKNNVCRSLPLNRSLRMIRLADLARRIWCCDSYQLTLLCIFPSDVFKIPLSKIEVSQSYQTRKANNSFVDDIKKAMLEEFSLDSVVYLVSVVKVYMT